MKSAKFLGFWFQEVCKYSWFLLIFMVLVIFMKLAGFHGLCLFLWSRQNVMIVAYFCEVSKIPWFLLIFVKLVKFHDFCVNFCKDGKISWFFAYFHEVAKFHSHFHFLEIDKISWFLLIFLKPEKLCFCLFSWSCKFFWFVLIFIKLTISHGFCLF